MLKLHFKSQDELIDALSMGYEELNIAIVNTILDNIDERGGEYKVSEIVFDEDDEIVDIFVEPGDYALTLQQNMEVFEELENYEMCAKIRDALNYLEKKY